LAFGAAALERGKNLIWFPEGRRSHGGDLQPFKPGVGLLLEHFRVPVVPVSINGTYEAMPPGRALVRPKKITVVFGEPLSVDDLERRGEGDRPQDRIDNGSFSGVAGATDVGPRFGNYSIYWGFVKVRCHLGIHDFLSSCA
jgi:long-chain acyl-CoA synthetase